MKLWRIYVGKPDARIVTLDFHVHAKAPSIAFAARLATDQLAVLVATSIAKRHGFRKMPQKHVWLPPVKER